MPGPALEISRVLARVLAPGGVLALTTVDLCGRSAEFICGLQLLRRHVVLNTARVLTGVNDPMPDSPRDPSVRATMKKLARREGLEPPPLRFEA